jgi:hypothetical protein
MHQLLCVLGLSLLPFAASAAGQQSGATPGATAQGLSFVAVEGFKLAVTHEAPAHPKLDVQCVLKLNDYALSGMFEKILRKDLTKEQLARANQFYSTPLATKYDEFALQQILAEHGKKVDNPIVFSNSEIAEANAFSASDAGIAVKTVASQSNAETLASLRPALLSLVAPCRK